MHNHYSFWMLANAGTEPRGLDNAGKTTIVKKLNGDDMNSVSPTLGFEIKTFIHGKYVLSIELHYQGL
jgi:hypothetical protein